MHKRGYILLLPVFLFLFSQHSYSQNKVKNVVIFFSYSSTLPAFHNVLDGFKSTFYENGDEPVNFILEYLDNARPGNDEYAKYIIGLYNKKFKEIKIDLLVTVGPGMNDLLLKYGDNVLKSVNIVNVDIAIPGRTPLATLHVKNGAEVVASFETSKTLKQEFALFPDYKNVFVISGTSKLDSFFTSLLMKSKTGFEPAYNFNFITGISMDSTIKFVGQLPENSILVVPTYLEDALGVPFSTPEVLNIISKNSKAPVFSLSDAFGNRDGGIGGYVLSYTNLGKEAGRIARQIINGTPLKDIKINKDGFYQQIYDWHQLKRWNLIGSKAIPANSVILNQESDFFDKYKWYILAISMFLLMETLLILYLFRLNRRQKAIVKQKEEADNLYRILAREQRLMTMVQLTASLSHELSQPLTSILYNTQACLQYQKSGGAEPGEMEELLLKIIKEDKRAGSLISSVRSLMKLEVREKEKVDLNADLQDTVTLFEPEATQNNIKVNIELQKNPVFVFGDKIQLQQVLLNLLYNAAHVLENVVSENRSIQISQQIEKGFVIVSVRDSGPGINEEIIKNIFNPFVTSRASGLGIGLALSRTIIADHNGEIWAENIFGGGAEFSFKLKLYKDEH